MNAYYHYADGIPFPYVNLPAPGDPLDDLTLVNILEPLLCMLASTAWCAHESHRDHDTVAGVLSTLCEQATSAQAIFQRWQDTTFPKHAEMRACVPVRRSRGRTGHRA